MHDAKAMSGSCCELLSLIQECTPMIKWMHCMFHCKVSVDRQLSLELRYTVEVISKTINFTKTHTVIEVKSF